MMLFWERGGVNPVKGERSPTSMISYNFSVIQPYYQRRAGLLCGVKPGKIFKGVH